jgi:hypothetical protein
LGSIIEKMKNKYSLVLYIPEWVCALRTKNPAAFSVKDLQKWKDGRMKGCKDAIEKLPVDV